MSASATQGGHNKWALLYLANSLWAGCPSRHPTSTVKPLEETQSIDANHWPGLNLSSSITRLRMEGTLLPICQPVSYNKQQELSSG